VQEEDVSPVVSAWGEAAFAVVGTVVVACTDAARVGVHPSEGAEGMHEPLCRAVAGQQAAEHILGSAALNLEKSGVRCSAYTTLVQRQVGLRQVEILGNGPPGRFAAARGSSMPARG
jgi:hypothetical protein